MLICKRPAATECEPPALNTRVPAGFIVGVSRSGTTLLRMMLDSHPALAIPPETHFIPDAARACEGADDPRAGFLHAVTRCERWDDFHMQASQLEQRLAGLVPFDLSQALRGFYGLYAERYGKPRWSDKTPAYLDHMRLIQRLLPEARFIHLVRDGRDVALSIKDRSFGPNTIEAAAQFWVEHIRSARQQQADLHYYVEVRYEDLVLDTKSSLKTICRFLDLPWDECMLHYYERSERRLAEIDRAVKDQKGNTIVSARERLAMHSLVKRTPQSDRVGCWRREMTAAQRHSFEQIAAPLLEEFGYEV